MLYCPTKFNDIGEMYKSGAKILSLPPVEFRRRNATNFSDVRQTLVLQSYLYDHDQKTKQTKPHAYFSYL
ncbi:unnamed protein product [Jaminaea pallidilutea]